MGADHGLGSATMNGFEHFQAVVAVVVLSTSIVFFLRLATPWVRLLLIVKSRRYRFKLFTHRLESIIEMDPRQPELGETGLFVRELTWDPKLRREIAIQIRQLRPPGSPYKEPF